MRRNGEIGDWAYFGVSESLPCRFAWPMPWMDPPPADCRAIGAEKLDRLYQDLRALSPETIRVRTLEHVSPHRGGYAIHYRWADVECEISDILDAEVDERDGPRFVAAQNLVFKAYQKP